MLHKTAILTFTFLLACAAYAQNETYYDEPGYSQSETETHTVKRGETLYAISKKYGMSVNELMRANNLRSNNIKIGQKLSIDSYNNKRITSRSQNDERGIQSGGMEIQGPRTFYKVQRGDNIYAIASEFGVLVDEIREWNGISTIQAGQTLIVGKNDVARIPANRPTPQNETREEDQAIYRKLSYRTASRSLGSQAQNRPSSRYAQREEKNSGISSYRRRNQNSASKRVSDDKYDKGEDTDYRRSSSNSNNNYSRRESNRDLNTNDKYDYDTQVEDQRFSSNNNSRRTESSYDDYQNENTNKRMPRAADIKYGSRAEVLYEYVGDADITTPNREPSRMNARTIDPRMDRDNSMTSNSSNLTGDFTELSSKKATGNRFYAFHNSLPIGSKVKMRIPQNDGFVEVEIIDRLPSYERVMIGLSPACTAILEGAGNPHTVTITAN